VLALYLMASTRNFLTARTMSRILDQASIVGVLAIGQAFVLIGGGFDLSQGAMVALTAGMTAWLVTGPMAVGPWSLGPLDPWAAAGLALAVGTTLGAINGLFVAIVRTNPFVTTLSTTLIYRGAAFVLLGGQPVAGVTGFAPLDRGPELGAAYLPTRVFVFLVLAAVAWFVLGRTVAGRHIYAVGGNLEASRLAGLRTRWLRVSTFAVSGAAAGLAALMLLSWVRVAKPDTATGYELESIAACVVGGVSLQGGTGRVPGAVAGVLILQALALLITMSGFPDEYRSIVTGGVILAFAALDALARRPGR
jgi:ribose/xylose/arabinose/galactoside ABC-type transport system permease subunit